ncbi:MAG: hypothetical protein IH599_02950 [Bacteroidales bacterium]|nr:hypothetical protein [Bacteroidales bacterium]
MYNNGGNPSYKNCNIEGSGGSASWNTALGSDAGNNIDSDPLFVNPSATAGVGGLPVSGDVDWSLQYISPCINAGDLTGLTLPVFDLDGNPRISGDTVDMVHMSTYCLPAES